MGFFNMLKARKVINEYSHKAITLFSEGAIYYTTNIPVIDEIIKTTPLLYITIDKNDKLLNDKRENFIPVFLEFDFFGQLFLATFSAKLVISTTPSLQVLALKKSPNVKHYSNFMHAITDAFYYQKGSFDYFDSIAMPGAHMEPSLRELEEARGLKRKELISLGTPYFDIYQKEFDSLTDISQGNYVLVAPSWGENNFLNHIDYDIFEILFQHGYNIIFRPHPMSFKYEPKLIEDILEKYNEGRNSLTFEVDREPSSIRSIKRSSFMVSFMSGIIFDFLFFAKAPVIIINMDEKRDMNKFEACDLKGKPWRNKPFKELCYLVDSKDSFIKALEDKKMFKVEDIDKYKNQVVNFGCAGKALATYYINKLNNL